MPQAVAPLERGARPLAREEAARHYLKFMLPAIPIMMFVLAVVYCAMLVGTGESVAASPGAVRMERADSALPLVGALLLAGTSAALCVMIYLGYLRISEQER
jgi:hypothetical protein